MRKGGGKGGEEKEEGLGKGEKGIGKREGKKRE